MRSALSYQSKTPPFVLAHELYKGLDGSSYAAQSVPGYPNVKLCDHVKVYDFLTRDLCSIDMDRIGDKLWWMSKQDSGSISPLHRQLVKRRTIVVTEDPKLHLVWNHDRVFVKPLPRYILSHAFWQSYLSGGGNSKRCPENIHKAALGLLRTYNYLIRYESDMHIAQDPALRLIPPNITWDQFCRFTCAFDQIRDRDVSLRYRFGEIRLTRLNWYAPLLLRKRNFQRIEYQYGTYFASFYGPLLFVVGMTSVILSAFQVCVAVEQAPDGSGLSRMAYVFSMIMIAVFLLVSVALCLIWLWKIITEWRVAIHDRLRLLEEGRLD